MKCPAIWDTVLIIRPANKNILLLSFFISFLV
jgi:hypothetical protein